MDCYLHTLIQITLCRKKKRKCAFIHHHRTCVKFLESLKEGLFYPATSVRVPTYNLLRVLHVGFHLGQPISLNHKCRVKMIRKKKDREVPRSWGRRVASEPLHGYKEKRPWSRGKNRVLSPQSTEESPNTYNADTCEPFSTLAVVDGVSA